MNDCALSSSVQTLEPANDIMGFLLFFVTKCFWGGQRFNKIIAVLDLFGTSKTAIITLHILHYMLRFIRQNSLNYIKAYITL